MQLTRYSYTPGACNNFSHFWWFLFCFFFQVVVMWGPVNYEPYSLKGFFLGGGGFPQF